MFFRRLICAIFGHKEVDVDLLQQGTNFITVSFIDRFGISYIMKMRPCERCVVYTKFYKENDLTEDEKIIKDIIE